MPQEPVEPGTPVPPPVPPPPPLPPPGIVDHQEDASHLKDARSDLIQAIREKAKAKAGIYDDTVHVQPKHLAPRVATWEVRDLMSEIRGAPAKKKLKKAKTVDKSKPFIPKDMEIYFYAGPNANKSLAPPPASREIPSQKSPSPPPQPKAKAYAQPKSFSYTAPVNNNTTRYFVVVM